MEPQRPRPGSPRSIHHLQHPRAATGALGSCKSLGVRQHREKNREKNLKSGRNLANPKMLHQNPNFPNQERSKREGGVKSTGRKGGFVGIKIKAGIFLPFPFPPRFLRASFAPEQQPLPLLHPSSQGGLCKSSPSSQESGLIQYYRVEKGRKNLVEMAEPAEKKILPKKRGEMKPIPSWNFRFGAGLGFYSLSESPVQHLGIHP